MRRIVTWVSGPLVAAFFLWLCFRSVPLDELIAQARGASVPLMFLTAVLVALHLATRALRWRTLLGEPGRRVPFVELFSAVSIGYMSSLLPGRVGEVIRPVLLSRRTAIPVGTAITSVGVERAVLDILGVVGCGAAGLLLPTWFTGLAATADPVLLERLRVSGIGVLAIGVAGVFVAALIARRRISIDAWVRQRAASASSRLVGKPLSWFAGMLPGFRAFETWGGVVRVVSETALIWFVIAVGNQVAMLASGISVSPGAALVLMPLLCLGIAIPTPGGTGGFHMAMKLGLVGLFGVGANAAAGTALIVHAVSWIPIVLLGLVFIVRGGLQRSPAVELEPTREGAG